MDSLKISYQNPAALKPRVTNPRTHSKKKQTRQIADSIERFGFTNPVLIDGNGGIVAGHGRIEAAIRLGIEKVPTIRLADLSAAEVRADVIADNKLAENAGWDRELLAIEFQGLLELELDIDVTIMGYRKLSARPRHHAQDPEAAAAFKKTFPTSSRRSAGSCQAAPR